MTTAALFNLMLTTWTLYVYSVWEWHWSSPLFFFVIVTYTASHFLLSLSPFHSCTTTAPHLPLLSLSQQWSMILSIHSNAPHRRAILAICLHRDSLLFLLNVLTAGKMTRTKCVMSICTKKEKQWRITGTDCHGWLVWNSTSHLLWN